MLCLLKSMSVKCLYKTPSIDLNSFQAGGRQKCYLNNLEIEWK